MDDLKTHLGQLHTNMEVAESENQVRQQFEREDDMERASREAELGESESPKVMIRPIKRKTAPMMSCMPVLQILKRISL